MKEYVKIVIVILIAALVSGFLVKDSPTKEEKMEWFKNAKLGVFIHWGIYSVNGISESWSFYNERISHEDYMKQLDGFTAENYKPKEWAKLIKESGAKYTVITCKHHDGVALWDTKQGDLNVVDRTPAKHNLIKPFAKAVRKEGLKLGLYYSLLDWSHPDYPNFTRSEKRYENDSIRWEKFVKFNLAQINEIGEYKPDLYWFDGDWEQSAEKWHAKEIREMILENNPNSIINSRLQGYGDYATPEQGVPITTPKNPYWELCLTMNDSWGYQPNDMNYKTANQVIRIFTDCISKGGNLLLDIGPKPDGTIPSEQVEILKELGRWTKKHSKAIYGTRAGIPNDYYQGFSALSKDKKMLYLFVDNKPNGPILVKGLNNKVNSSWVVGNGTHLNTKVMSKAYWSKVPGLLYIDLPEEVQDKQVTVIALLLDGEIDLYKNK